MPDIDVLLSETRTFPPDEAFRRAAHVADTTPYERAAADPEGWWAAQARELEWSRPWDEVMRWEPPHVQWFVGGTLNVSVNCIDRHLTGPTRNKAALVWEGEPGDRRTLTYWDLYCEVT